MTETGRDYFIKSREIMCCPRCGGDLTAPDGRLVCGGCGQAFDFDGQARRGPFAKLLDDQIPFGTRVLECGCGTGQLTTFCRWGGGP